MTEVKWYGNKVQIGVGQLVSTRLRLCAIMTHRYMQTHMTPRPAGAGGRRHVPSQPGQPPAVNTGNLRSDIMWELDNGTSSQATGTDKGATRARIGVTKKTIYGLYLELGAPKRNLKPRPWMRPALNAVLRQLVKVFQHGE